MSKLKRDIPAAQLAELRQHQPFSRLLIRAHRALIANTNARLEAMGYTGFRGTQGTVIAQVDPNGTRLSTIAERLEITKQSVSQLVNDLEQNDYLKRTEDPSDKRASLVRFTERGWQFCQDANQVRLELEAEYEAALGKEAMDTLRALLEKLVEHGNR